MPIFLLSFIDITKLAGSPTLGSHMATACGEKTRFRPGTRVRHQLEPGYEARSFRSRQEDKELLGKAGFCAYLVSFLDVIAGKHTT